MRHTPEVDDILLLPGRYSIGGRGCRMRAVLGPGVVITLWRRAQPIGAMAHFLVPTRGTQRLLELDGRSGEAGLQEVLQGLRRARAEPDDCVARICGSSNVFLHSDRVPSLNTGHGRGELARQLLRAYGIPIVSESFYAIGRHQITFDVDTGRVRARRIKPTVIATATPPQSVAPHRERAPPQRIATFRR